MRSVIKRDPEYRVWSSMLNRCSNPKCDKYEYYGGRGITVCARWKYYKNFIADMGKRPSSSHQINRLKNNLPYSPENCNWSTRIENMRNRSNTIFVTYNGTTQPLVALCESLGLSYESMRHRVRRLPIEQAISRPYRSGPNKKQLEKAVS